MNALFALTMESKREFGILRYLGASTGAVEAYRPCASRNTGSDRQYDRAGARISAFAAAHIRGQ